MDLHLFFTEVIMLYVIALVGFLTKKRGLLTQHTDAALTQVVLYVALPCLILFSMDVPFSLSLVHEFTWLIMLSIYALSVACLVAHMLTKRSGLKPDRAGIYKGMIIFGNQGFIGYAIVYVILGQEGVLYTAIFNLPYLLLIWTYGIYIVARQQMNQHWKTLFLNPGVLATTTGFLLLLFPISWPLIMADALETVGISTIPLTLLLIGSLVGGIRWQQMKSMLFDAHIWLATAAKLLIIPLFLLPFGLLSVPLPLFIVAVLLTGTPSAPTISLYAQQYGGDHAFASMGVCLSTLFSILTLPALFYLISHHF